MSTALVEPTRERARLLENLYEPIADHLAEVERIYAEELASDVPFVQELVEHLGHYRGKRLRPALLLLTAKACGEVTRNHNILAAVVEMVHTATLVHDDVLDRAEMRRHVPTINARWGNAGSVLLGDLLFTHAFYLAATTGSAEACRLIGEATNHVCAGELHQIGEQGNFALTEDTYFAIIDGKTAALTACCCRLGARFSGTAEPIIASMTRFGIELGIAFQIADDVLDIVGQEDEAGKSLGTDLEQQKLTLPVIRLLRQASPNEAIRLQALLESAGPRQRDELVTILKENEALTYSIHRAEQHAANARQELACLPVSESRRILEELTRQVVHRKR
jgi:octaprenyl-diphosphate synthase